MGTRRETDFLHKQEFRNTLTHRVRNGELKYSNTEDCYNLSLELRGKDNSA